MPRSLAFLGARRNGDARRLDTCAMGKSGGGKHAAHLCKKTPDCEREVAGSISTGKHYFCAVSHRFRARGLCRSRPHSCRKSVVRVTELLADFARPAAPSRGHHCALRWTGDPLRQKATCCGGSGGRAASSGTRFFLHTASVTKARTRARLAHQTLVRIKFNSSAQALVARSCSLELRCDAEDGNFDPRPLSSLPWSQPTRNKNNICN